jgi:hypothetical protein
MISLGDCRATRRPSELEGEFMSSSIEGSKLKMVGGYKYRFLKADGSHIDVVLMGSGSCDTLWRADDSSVRRGADVFKDAVEIVEIWRPERRETDADRGSRLSQSNDC